MKVLEVKPKIILASQSPRRRYLLERAGLTFAVVPSTFDESSLPASPVPADDVRLLAESKAADIAGRFPDAWVIGADTVVVVDGLVLGKPGSEADARRMLQRLSGRAHQVLTGYCIRHPGAACFSDTVCTEVVFKHLSAEEIDWYVATGEPFDKAGAYAIQGIGTFLVKRINGSYTNVVGLPVCEVIEYLIRQRVIGFNGSPAPAGPGGAPQRHEVR